MGFLSKIFIIPFHHSNSPTVLQSYSLTVLQSYRPSVLQSYSPTIQWDGLAVNGSYLKGNGLLFQKFSFQQFPT